MRPDAINAVVSRRVTLISEMGAPTFDAQQEKFADGRHVAEVSTATALQGAVNKQDYHVAQRNGVGVLR